MSKKNKNDHSNGLVFSTHPDAISNFFDDDSAAATPEIGPDKQQLRIWLDRKNRAGKEATLIKGFSGSEEQLKDLAKMLKTKLGVGGAAKEGDIIIQGDHRDKVLDILVKAGYTKAKKAGG